METERFIEIRGNKFILDDEYLEWHRKNLYEYTPKSNTFCFRWINRPHKFEIEEHTLVEKHLRRDSNVIDLGGFIGTLSCAINKSLKNPNNHVVTEIHPFYTKYLQKNRDINNCKFEILNRVDKLEELNVDYFFDTIIADIEGDEFRFIIDNFDYISTHVELIIVEVHKRYCALPSQPEKSNKTVPINLRRQCLATLDTKFKKVDFFKNTLVYRRK
jgi:hypothetical protein